jgi:predicted RNase H-like HicB family nuclease
MEQTMPKREVKLKGNTFKYLYYKTSNYEPDETGYCAFVPLFKGCATQAETLTELDKNVKLAIKDWLEPTSITVAKRQRLEQLERLVASKDYFCKALAENFSDELVNKGFKQWGMGYSYLNDNKYKIASDAFTAGIKYALKAQSEGQ